MPKTREWLILNAVYAWLYHYSDQANADEYRKLKEELENEQSKNTTSKKRGRPAKRQRTQKTTSIEVSKTASKDA